MMLEVRNKHFLHQDYLVLLNAVAGWGSQKAVATALQKNWVFYLLKVLEILCCVGKKDQTMDFKVKKDKSGSWFLKDLVQMLSAVLIYEKKPTFCVKYGNQGEKLLGASIIALWQGMINRYRKIICHINTEMNWLDEPQNLPIKTFKRSVILYPNLSVFPPSM